MAGHFLSAPNWRDRGFLLYLLRTETVGGALMLAAAVVALILANTPMVDVYNSVRDFHVGPESLHLHLSLADWVKDGLLAIFFFVAGMELKREFVVGDLRDPRAAALPIVAAFCGMAVPALIYVVTSSAGGGSLGGWAIPMATDIAFALAVLAVIGTALPSALRAFLLTLAIVDDLGAIVVIALFYSSTLNLWALAGAIVGLLVFALLHRRGVPGWYVYIPLAVIIWALTHASGIHATVSGVVMGLILRTHKRDDEKYSPAQRVEHAVSPISAGLVVPVFALFAAGVTISGDGVASIFRQPETLGVVLGLVLGKPIGVFCGSWLAARFTRAELNPDLKWADVFAVSILAGIGFTVSLLIAELSFAGTALGESVKAAVLIGTALATVLAAIVLKLRNRHYRLAVEAEERDEDENGIPDIYEETTPDFHARLAERYQREADKHREAARRPEE
ncbi:MAG: Na+/H+ antiporter NhaA [Nocardiaceae bacterium]|nr:Na+/H+ antiporter NhaA [Nocardiaceae bacterium]